MPETLHLAAFPDGREGGNPAGVVLNATAMDAAHMLSLAAEVGHAETVFVTDPAIDGDERHVRVRYFSPVAEVPFCGHATIALAVALAHRRGTGSFTIETTVGPIVLETAADAGADITASFTSVPPETRPLGASIARRLLDLLGLQDDDLLPQWPLWESFAGNWHPIVAVRDRARFDGFAFDPDDLRTLMDEAGWAGTVTVVHPTEHGGAAAPTAIPTVTVEARNLFPVGTLTEDPATGSAAAALGGYLREIGTLATPGHVTVRQGHRIGRPCLLIADVPATGGIVVRGTARFMQQL